MLAEEIMTTPPRYPGIRVTANGNQLVSYHTEMNRPHLSQVLTYVACIRLLSPD
jgi:hypothetical protein